MKAAQIASMPPSGPRKSQVATAPRTPRLIAKAVFKDISPPFAGWRAGGCPRLPAVHRLYGAEAYFYAIFDSASD
jgi:hypothetical protein